MSGQRHVLFDAGGLPLAVPAEAVQAIHDELAVQRVEGTREWFLGLAVADGRLLPVTDLAAWLGRRAAAGRTLQLHADVGLSGLRVDTVYGLSHAGAEPDADAGAGAIGDGTVTALTIVQDERRHRVLDLAGLLQSARFLDVSADDP